MVDIIKENFYNGTFYGYYNDVEFISHRDHGPAIIFNEGELQWRSHNTLHREDGPAIIYSDGTETWYKNGHIHREDGPAVSGSDGSTYYWINGNCITCEVEKWFKERNIDEHNMSEEDKLALTFFMRSLI